MSCAGLSCAELSCAESRYHTTQQLSSVSRSRSVAIDAKVVQPSLSRSPATKPSSNLKDNYNYDKP